MDVSGTLNASSAAISRKPTMARASFPNPGFWLGLVILTMTVREVTLWQVGAAHGRIGDMVLLLVFGLWFGGRCLIGRFSIIRNHLDLAVMIFLIFYVMSILWTDNVEAGSVRLLKLLRNWILYILLADYLSANFRGRYQRIAVCILLAGLFQSIAFMVSISWGGGLTALNTLLQTDVVMSNDPLLAVVRGDEGAGLFMKGVASWLPLCMFIGFSIGSWIRSRRLALGNWVLISGMGVLTLLSATRAAMVGLAVGLIIICCLTASEISMTMKKAVHGGMLVLALVLGAWYFNLHTLIRSRFSFGNIEKDPAVVGRLDFFEFTLDRFAESPLLGVGVSGIFPEGLTAVHNVYLQVLGELGVVGGGMFLWMLGVWVLYLMSARTLTAKRGDPLGNGVAVVMLGASAFFFTYFLVGHDLGSGEPWIIMSIASALHNDGRRISSSSSDTPSVPVASPAKSGRSSRRG